MIIQLKKRKKERKKEIFLNLKQKFQNDKLFMPERRPSAEQ